ncbi:hypothetical protein [Chitinophaga sp. 212800010-3]|uniref:hypothetical protein n=1 Tax=unclassified Chitinophaga TaxID=2619133 RepID=UPI002DF4433B|nr:hypothetical protein [Chitinophaga sp. 212800010-3]
MKKICLLSSAVLLFFSVNAGAPVNPVAGKQLLTVKAARPASVGEFISNSSSTTTAYITLTSTTGGPNYNFTVSPNSSLSNQTIADGTYNISINGGGNLRVERCDNDLVGYPGAPVPYTYNNYNTAQSGKLIIVVY